MYITISFIQLSTGNRIELYDQSPFIRKLCIFQSRNITLHGRFSLIDLLPSSNETAFSKLRLTNPKQEEINLLHKRYPLYERYVDKEIKRYN